MKHFDQELWNLKMNQQSPIESWSKQILRILDCNTHDDRPTWHLQNYRIYYSSKKWTNVEIETYCTAMNIFVNLLLLCSEFQIHHQKSKFEISWNLYFNPVIQVDSYSNANDHQNKHEAYLRLWLQRINVLHLDYQLEKSQDS